MEEQTITVVLEQTRAYTATLEVKFVATSSLNLAHVLGKYEDGLRQLRQLITAAHEQFEQTRQEIAARDMVKGT